MSDPVPTIRPYRARADDDALAAVCLRTAAEGGDATGRYRDGALPGHVYLGPYLRLCPELGLVVDDGSGPVGYLVGVTDTAWFEDACERTWWPALRERYPLRTGRASARQTVADPDATWDDRLVRLIHTPPRTSPTILRSHPAHLHVDLLPSAQGHGLGRALIERFRTELAGRGVPGVHLTHGPANTRAAGFYARLGFAPLWPGLNPTTLGRAVGPG